MSVLLTFDVIGHPEPAGSKRAVSIRRKGGGGWVAGGARVIDANPKAAPWKAEVAFAAHRAMLTAYGPSAGCVIPPQDPLPAPGSHLFDGPLGLRVTFRLKRPKGHFGSGRNAGAVRHSAPRFPCVKPDATKLLRGVEDALTGVVWRDDAQIVEQFVSKRYGEPEGVEVIVWAL